MGGDRRRRYFCRRLLWRRDFLPQLGGKPARIDGEDLPRDGRLLTLARPIVDHRVLVPDHGERNDFRAGLVGAEFAHGLARPHLLVRLAADRAVALHASPDLPLHAAPHDGAGGIDLGGFLRLELFLGVERGDHPIRHRRPGVTRIGEIDIAGRLTIRSGIGKRRVGGMSGREAEREEHERRQESRGQDRHSHCGLADWRQFRMLTYWAML